MPSVDGVLLLLPDALRNPEEWETGSAAISDPVEVGAIFSS